VVAGYTEGDWVRAIRHGIAPSGRALLIMPSEDYNRMSDADFAALVAYVRSLPPVRGEPAEMRLPLIVKALYGAGYVKDAAEKIDHRKPPPPPVAAGRRPWSTARMWRRCARGAIARSLEGGPIAGAPPEWPAAANLTPAGTAMSRYDSPDKFVAMMRTGKRPDGSAVSAVMPFMSLRNMNDTDLQAMYLYLRAPSRARRGEVKPRFFATPAKFRAWLEKNHASAAELWVGFHKVHTGKPSITCRNRWTRRFASAGSTGCAAGWTRTPYMIRFTPRRPDSIWSNVNTRRVGELTKSGLMSPRESPLSSGATRYAAASMRSRRAMRLSMRPPRSAFAHIARRGNSSARSRPAIVATSPAGSWTPSARKRARGGWRTSSPCASAASAWTS
jgi:hypothetical protein